MKETFIFFILQFIYVKLTPFFTEKIGPITIDYLPNWDIVQTVNIEGESISYEKYLRSCGSRLAKLAEEKGFTSIVIGRIDDFYFAHVDMGNYIELDRNHIVKFS